MNAITHASVGEPLEAEAGAGQSPRPSFVNTLLALALLSLTALILSYLGAFALTGALVAADVLEPWPAGDADPRLSWMLTAFLGLLAVFIGVGCAFRHVSRRQLRRIDAMAEAEAEGDGSGMSPG